MNYAPRPKTRKSLRRYVRNRAVNGRRPEAFPEQTPFPAGLRSAAGRIRPPMPPPRAAERGGRARTAREAWNTLRPSGEEWRHLSRVLPASDRSAPVRVRRGPVSAGPLPVFSPSTPCKAVPLAGCTFGPTETGSYPPETIGRTRRRAVTAASPGGFLRDASAASRELFKRRLAHSGQTIVRGRGRSATHTNDAGFAEWAAVAPHPGRTRAAALARPPRSSLHR
jgi:hypothetical protein